MHSSREIAIAAGSLANQVRAGLPVSQAAERLMEQQPAYAEFWREVSTKVGNGTALSAALKGYWPSSFVAALEAGEESGEPEKILAQIETTIQIESDLKKHAMKLAYPVGMVLGGVGVFIFFMGFVMPSLARSLRSKSKSAIIDMAFWMESVIQQNGLVILLGLAVAIVLLVYWIRTQEAKDAIGTFLLGLPGVGPALADLSFGLWSYYMAVMTAAGVETIRAFDSTVGVLPQSLQPVIRAINDDLKRGRDLSDASDPRKAPVGDPRKSLPFYISIALKISHETGEIDKELTKIAPALIKEGVAKLNVAVSISEIVAMAVAAAAIMTPLGAYYLQLFANIRTVG